MRRLVLDHAWIDQKAAPIYVVRFPLGRTHEATREFWDHIRGAYAREPNPEPFGWVLLMEGPQSSEARGRKIAIDHFSQVQGYLAAHCFGLAAVIDSSLMRGIMTAWGWMQSALQRTGTSPVLVPSLADAVVLLERRRSEYFRERQVRRSAP